jgi:hypothetical protein
MLRTCLLIIFAFVLTACGTSLYVKEMKDSKSALVFGYITEKNSPLYFHWVQLKRTDAAGNEEYYTTRSDQDGMFYAENLPLGQYQIHRIGWGNTPMGSNAIAGGGELWSFGAAGKATMMQVTKPGVQYFGSFRFTLIKGKGVFRSDSFNFERAGSPPENELLERLLTYTKDTRWADAIRKRRAELQ